MKINDLKLHVRIKIFAHYESSIGKLYLASLSVRNEREFIESLGKPLEECNPEDFARRLMVYVCFQGESLSVGDNKPNEIMLTDEDVKKLSTEEIEKLAEIYIEHQDYLYKKTVYKSRKDEDGKEVVYSEEGGVEYPRNEGETAIQYLHRLYVLQGKKMKEQFSEMTKSIIGQAKFSNHLIEDIKKTLTMGDSLSKITQGLNIPSVLGNVQHEIRGIDFRPEFDSISKLQIPQIDYDAIEKKRRAPFDALGKRLDQLIDLTGKTVEISSNSLEFSVGSNKTQTSIAAEIKSSGETAEKTAKMNIFLTVVVIIITVIGLFFNGIALTRSTKDGKAMNDQVSNAIDKLDSVNKNLVLSNEKSIEQFQNIFNKYDMILLDQRKTHNEIITQQVKKIEQLERQNLEYNLQISSLKDKLSKMESKLNEIGDNEKSRTQTEGE